MAYIAPYKLSVKRSSTSSDQGNSAEGIQAFLNRVQKARQDADQREDLAMQEKVTKGEISLDEQIDYNKRRQERFVPTSKEYQQLNNNIADIQVAKKWEAYNLMDVQSIPHSQQLSFLRSWSSSLDQGSDLANQILQKEGALQVKIARDEYSTELEKQKTEFDQGRSQRSQVISYLKGKLSNVTDENLKMDIQSELDNQKTALKQDADNLRNSIISSYDRTGDLTNEGSLIGLLEDDYKKDLADGDVASASSRKGDIESQKRNVALLSIQHQIDMADSEQLSKLDVSSSQKYIGALKSILQKGSMDFSYKGADGTDQSFRMEDLSTLRGSDGKTVTQSLNDRIQNFVSKTYIPQYMQSLSDDFNSLAKREGVSFEDLQGKAGNILKQFNDFQNQSDIKPFSGILNQQSTGLQDQLANQLLTNLGNKFSEKQKTDVDAVRGIQQIRQMLPGATGDTFEQTATTILQNIGGENFSQYQSEFQRQLGEQSNAAKEQLSQIAAASQRLNILNSKPETFSADNAAKIKELDASSLKVNNFLTKLSQESGQFDKQFQKGDSRQFIPDTQTGKNAAPTYKLSKLDTKVPDWVKGMYPDIKDVKAPNIFTPPKIAVPPKIQASASYQIKVPNTDILKKYKGGEVGIKNGSYYLNKGIEQRW